MTAPPALATILELPQWKDGSTDRVSWMGNPLPPGDLSIRRGLCLKHGCEQPGSMRPPRPKHMRPPSLLQEHQAIAIFTAKFDAQARDGTCALLAVCYNTSSKVVRDIWNVRTWTGNATRLFWRPEDKQFTIVPEERMCVTCKDLGIEFLDIACDKCLSKLGAVLEDEPYQSSKQCRTPAPARLSAHAAAAAAPGPCSAIP